MLDAKKVLSKIAEYPSSYGGTGTYMLSMQYIDLYQSNFSIFQVKSRKHFFTRLVQLNFLQHFIGYFVIMHL